MQKSIKESYDPNNVLYKNELFNFTKLRKMGPLDKLLRENKQVNFVLNKFGMGL